MLQESGTSREPLTSSTAVDWQMSPDLFELNFPMGLYKLNNSFDSQWICYCKQDLIRRNRIMSLCSEEAKNGISSECLSVVSEKDEHGTVTKDDWMHIVNKHPRLSGFASCSQSLHKDVPYNILSALAAQIVYH